MSRHSPSSRPTASRAKICEHRIANVERENIFIGVCQLNCPTSAFSVPRGSCWPGCVRAWMQAATQPRVARDSAGTCHPRTRMLSAGGPGYRIYKAIGILQGHARELRQANLHTRAWEGKGGSSLRGPHRTLHTYWLGRLQYINFCNWPCFCALLHSVSLRIHGRATLHAVSSAAHRPRVSVIGQSQGAHTQRGHCHVQRSPGIAFLQYGKGM